MTARGDNGGRSNARISRVTRLELESWRNFRRVEIAAEGRVFLTGPNASGKSNLLDALRFLRDIVAVGGGFRAAVQRRGGVSALRNLAARQNPAVRIGVDLGTDSEPRLWSYELTFGQNNQRQPVVQRERVLRLGEPMLDRPDAEDQKDAARLSQTALEQVNVNRAFRDVAEFLLSVRYLHIVPQLVREPDRSTGRTNDPYGGDFLEQVAGTPAGTRKSRLARISKALAVAVPQLQELELERDARGTPHLRGRYSHWRAQGAWQREADFSDGTLRLLGLLWASLDGAGPLLLEEPELSLHPAVVRHIPQMIARIQGRRGRQFWVSTHSTELLSDAGIGLDEVLLLSPEGEGTEVRAASDDDEIETLLEEGVSLADIVVPRTSPNRPEQIAFVADGM